MITTVSYHNFQALSVFHGLGCCLGSDWLAELVEVQNGGSHNLYGLNYSWFRGNGNDPENEENTH